MANAMAQRIVTNTTLDPSPNVNVWTAAPTNLATQLRWGSVIELYRYGPLALPLRLRTGYGPRRA